MDVAGRLMSQSLLEVDYWIPLRADVRRGASVCLFDSVPVNISGMLMDNCESVDDHRLPGLAVN